MKKCIGIALVFAIVSSVVRAQSGTALKNLKTALFKNSTQPYSTKVRPVNEQANPVAVTIDFALVGINAFSDSDQKLTTTGYLTVVWTDELLTWTEADYENITSILVPQKQVWLPDVTLENGMASKSLLGKSFIQVTITSSGQTTWSPYEVFETSCSVDIVHFPFDQQTCQIKFSSWTHSQQEISLSHGTRGFYTSNFEKNGKWDIISMTTDTETAAGKTVLVYTLNLQRKSSFYVLFIILPAILLSLLNAFVFVLPAGSGEKVGYCISVFLSYALFYTILSDSLPRNSDTVSTVAAYLFFMMFLSTLACVVTITQLRIFNKPITNRVPSFFVRLVKVVLFHDCKAPFKYADEDIDGEWTRVIGQFVDCDWKDFVDALDFILFWIFLLVTIATSVVTFVMASQNIPLL